MNILLKKMIAVIAVSTVAGLAYQAAYSADQKPAGKKADREFALVNIEYEGTKVWVPSVLIVKKGETVRLTLVNNAPSGVHGFAIPDFNVSETVNKGGKKTVEFKADKDGLYRMHCQLHPAHIGGQLLVLK